MENDRLNKFLTFEAESCFDYTVDGIRIWKYLREFVYDEYIRKIYKTEARVHSCSDFKFGMYLVGQLWRILQPDERYSPKDILFISFPRKTMINGSYICTQLQPLMNKFDNHSWIVENPFWIEDKSYFISHFTSKKSSMTFTDKIEIKHMISMLFRYASRCRFAHNNDVKIMNFLNNIEVNLQIHLDYKEYLNKIFWYVSFEKYARTYYEKLLHQVAPKCIVEVYTPNHQIALLNTIAHENGIPVIDVQHGAIGTYEPIMYSYHKKRNYQHLSDFIFTFGEYWTKKENYHLKKECIFPVGVPYLEEKVREVADKPIKKEAIVIISQARHSNLFYTLARDLHHVKEIIGGKRIILKLHPYEYSSYISGFYKDLENEGVQVDAGLNKHLYEYFGNACCVIGINSTALYEALAFGIPVYVYANKYGVENLLELSRNSTQVHLFKDKNDLIDKLKNHHLTNALRIGDTEGLFASNAMERALSALEKICGVIPEGNS